MDLAGSFIACNFSWKSTDRGTESKCRSLLTKWIAELADTYHMADDDADSIFIRTNDGRQHVIDYAKSKGIDVEYYEFKDNDINSRQSILAYGFRMFSSEALTGELLKI